VHATKGNWKVTTPEGRVKTNIKRVLDAFGVYYLMPVQMGLGAAGVDFHCVTKVTHIIENEPRDLPIAFFIEAKKPGDEPTGRQRVFMEDRRKYQNAMSFVIDDDPSIKHVTGGLEALTKWLEQIEDQNERTREQFNHAVF
jgi:hypothetical protein